jgi:3-oxoacyl-[acyl-carrier-protein] synthase II
VITGSGVISSLGNTTDEMWESAIAARSGTGRLSLIDDIEGAEAYPCQVSGEVRDFDPTDYLNRKDARRMARFSQFAVATSKQAVEAAGLDLAQENVERVGTVFGNGGGGLPNTDQAMRTLLKRGGMRVDPLYIAKMLPNMGAGNITIQLGLLGYTNTVTTACAAGTQAVGDATEVIRRGAADVMLAGGCEAGISELGLASFASMRALATAHNETPEVSSRPFDRDRSGLVPAEGGAMLVLEGLDHALARGATPLAEISGYGVSADASFLVAPPEDGNGGARAMKTALADAGIPPEAVDCVSAHATATQVGDIAETRALRTVFGEHAYRMPVTAMKSQTGHLLGGSGGLELAAAVCMIGSGSVPPTINLDHPDPECDLDYVPNEARKVEVNVLMKNSFGFGGQNAVLILTRYDG